MKWVYFVPVFGLAISLAKGSEFFLPPSKTVKLTFEDK